MERTFSGRQLGLAKLSCKSDELLALQAVVGRRLLSNDLVRELRSHGYDSWFRLLATSHRKLLSAGIAACDVHQLDRILAAVGWHTNMSTAEISEQLNNTILPAEIIANSPVT